MLIKPFDDSQLVDAYGIKYHQLYPAGGDHLADWGFGRAVIEPGGRTDPHQHTENEVFIILGGAGEMVIGEESSPIAAGEFVLIPADREHQLRNGSATESLEFLSIYWPLGLGALDL
jgi:mannose-6-phosphate isomerase-like protein (cupin superfamily)